MEFKLKFEPVHDRKHTSADWVPGLERGLPNYWYPIAVADTVRSDPIAVKRLNRKLVVWRDGSGRPHVLDDRCAHRGAALSIGRIWGDLLECKYHGFVYDGTGKCVEMPTEPPGPASEKKIAKIRVPAYPTREEGGMIWAFLYSEDAQAGEAPTLSIPSELADEQFLGWWKTMVFETNWLLVQDNNADFLHVPFLHDPRYRYGENPMHQKIRVFDVDNGFKTMLADDGASVTPNEESSSFTFQLPCMFSSWLPPSAASWIRSYHEDPELDTSRPEAFDEEPPFRVIQYMYPIDLERTVFQSWYGRKCDNDAERRHWQQLHDEHVRPSHDIVFEQDNEAFKALGGLESARSSEWLFNLDIGTIRIRRLLNETYLNQSSGVSSTG